MNKPPNAASVALIDGDKMLLIQRARAPYHGLWTLPGGRMEPGETAEQCAIREVSEELGLTISALRDVGRQAIRGRFDSWHLAVFATQSFEGRLTPSDEINDYRWVRPSEINGFDTTPLLQEFVSKIFALYTQN